MSLATAALPDQNIIKYHDDDNNNNNDDDLPSLPGRATNSQLQLQKALDIEDYGKPQLSAIPRSSLHFVTPESLASTTPAGYNRRNIQQLRQFCQLRSLAVTGSHRTLVARLILSDSQLGQFRNGKREAALCRWLACTTAELEDQCYRRGLRVDSLKVNLAVRVMASCLLEESYREGDREEAEEVEQETFISTSIPESTLAPMPTPVPMPTPAPMSTPAPIPTPAPMPQPTLGPAERSTLDKEAENPTYKTETGTETESETGKTKNLQTSVSRRGIQTPSHPIPMPIPPKTTGFEEKEQEPTTHQTETDAGTKTQTQTQSKTGRKASEEKEILRYNPPQLTTRTTTTTTTQQQQHNNNLPFKQPFSAPSSPTSSLLLNLHQTHDDFSHPMSAQPRTRPVATAPLFSSDLAGGSVLTEGTVPINKSVPANKSRSFNSPALSITATKPPTSPFTTIESLVLTMSVQRSIRQTLLYKLQEEISSR